jgi:hypothetical protein
MYRVDSQGGSLGGWVAGWGRWRRGSGRVEGGDGLAECAEVSTLCCRRIGWLHYGCCDCITQPSRAAALKRS